MIGPTVKTWEDWKNVYHQREAWLGIVAEVFRREGIVYNKIENATPGTSAVFIADRTYVLKIYPGPFMRDHDREWPVLRLLEKAVGRKLLIASGVIRDGEMTWPYAIFPYIEGTPYRALVGRLNQAEAQAFHTALASLLRKVHHLPADPLQGDPVYAWCPKEEKERRLNKAAVQLGERIQNVTDGLADFVERGWADLKGEPLHLVHGDLTADHLLFRRVDGRWTFEAVIDWGDAHLAPIYYDFVVLWTEVFCDQPSAWQAFIRRYDERLDAFCEAFRRRFITALFLHPYAPDLLRIIHEKRKLGPTETFSAFETYVDWMYPAGRAQ